MAVERLKSCDNIVALSQELGRTTETKGRRANAQVGVDADRLRFRDIFMTGLGVR